MFFPKDRAVQFPDRYKLNHVPGTDDIADLVPAPGDITEEGDIFNLRAAQLLQADRRRYIAGMDLKPGDVVDVQEDGTVKAELAYDAGALPAAQAVENINFVTTAATADDDLDCIIAVGYGKPNNYYSLYIGQIANGQLIDSFVIDTNTTYNNTIAYGNPMVARVSKGVYVVTAGKNTSSSSRALTVWIIQKTDNGFTILDSKVILNGDYYPGPIFPVEDTGYPYVLFMMGDRLVAYNLENNTTAVTSPSYYYLSVYAGFISDESATYFGYNFFTCSITQSNARYAKTVCFNPKTRSFVQSATYSYSNAPALYGATYITGNLLLSRSDGIFAMTVGSSDGYLSGVRVSDTVFAGGYYYAGPNGRAAFIYNPNGGTCVMLQVNGTGRTGKLSATCRYEQGTSNTLITFPHGMPVVIGHGRTLPDAPEMYLYQYFYNPDTVELGGSVEPASSDAIVLEEAKQGDEVEVIFSGTAKFPGIKEGDVIASPGVFGGSPLDGILSVSGKWRPDRAATGWYWGTGTYGADNPVTLDFGFKPKLVIIQGGQTTSNAVSQVATGTFVSDMPFATCVRPGANPIGIYVTYTETGISFYGTGSAQNNLNLNAPYYYIAFR